MRIADNMTFEQVKSNLTKNRSEMAELQNQAATQKRVTKPSDDPVAASRVLGSRVELSGNKQFLKSLDYAKSFLDYTDQSLDHLTQALVRAKELAINQASDASANEQSRRVTATEIEQIYNQVVQIGNRKLGDRFIFGGFKTTTKPFDLKGNYGGDNGEMMIHTDKASFIAMNVPGAKVFLGEGLTGDGVSHTTTKQATTIEEFEKQQQDIKEAEERQRQIEANSRGPASATTDGGTLSPPPPDAQPDYRAGVNVFNVIKNLEISLNANDKSGVQDSLEAVDEAISQVVMARAQVGSRVMAIDNAFETLQKAKVDNQASISSLEDADAFSVVSDINKTESTLQATLATSGKLIQPSLLSFLR